MSHDCFPPLELPAIDQSLLVRGCQVQTRYFFADSLPGSKSTVVRTRNSPQGVWVRCNFGKNQGGHSLLKWMCADALAQA